jgi:hypothetical protein
VGKDNRALLARRKADVSMARLTYGGSIAKKFHHKGAPMPIIRLNKTTHNFLRDARLSYKARGMLAYILSHEHDWEVHVDDLVKQSQKDGRTAVQSALQELLMYHYAILHVVRDSTGKVRGKEYVVYDVPTDRQVSRQTENLSVGTDAQVSRQTGNLSVGENGVIVSDPRSGDAPTSRFPDRRETCLITKDNLKTKDKERKTGRNKETKSMRTSGGKSRARSDARAQIALDAHEVLAYFNTVHQRDMRRDTFIQALLATGVTVDNCKLVIDWLYAVERVENPEGYDKYVNNVTPFRPDNFDRHLDRARRWKAGPRAQDQPKKLSGGVVL